jgi:hypothetical protein
MTIEEEGSDLFFIDQFELLRFVRKQCMRMLESNTIKGHGVWIGLSLAALQMHPDLELRFRKIWVDGKETLCEESLHETADILDSAIARIEAFNQMDIDMAIMDADEDPTEDLAIPRESLPKIGRWLLFYLRQEAREMLERDYYECLPIWEHLFLMSLSLILGRGELREGSPCLDLAPDEKLRVGLDVIRDVLFRRKPEYNPWLKSTVAKGHRNIG